MNNQCFIIFLTLYLEVTRFSLYAGQIISNIINYFLLKLNFYKNPAQLLHELGKMLPHASRGKEEMDSSEV